MSRVAAGVRGLPTVFLGWLIDRVVARPRVYAAGVMVLPVTLSVGFVVSPEVRDFVLVGGRPRDHLLPMGRP